MKLKKKTTTKRGNYVVIPTNIRNHMTKLLKRKEKTQ